ncbi:hypothetical protein [Ferrovibrio sp.]
MASFLFMAGCEATGNAQDKPHGGRIVAKAGIYRGAIPINEHPGQ